MLLTFWVSAALMLLAAIALLAWPLWRTSARVIDQDAGEGSGAGALDVLRDQRRELDREVAAGRMSDAEREQRITELSRRVVEEGLTAPAENVASRPVRRSWLGAGVALLVPLIALPVYLLVGNPEALDPAARAPAAAAKGHVDFTSVEFRTMLANLKARLEAGPGDAEGWLMLGRGLRAVDDAQGSVDAFAKAVALAPDDATALVEYADALASTHNRDLSGKPSELVQRALQLNPKLPKALAMAGAAEFAQGRFDAARRYWSELLGVLPAGSKESDELKQMIAQLDMHTGVAAGKTAGPLPAPGAGGATPAKPAAVAAPPAATVASAGKSVSGVVRIAPSLAAKAGPDDTLFIYARAAEGPRMPLAIVRAKARELPFQFHLDDSQAMAGGPTLSSVAQVRIEARVSKSGQAIPQSGDLRGESAIVAPGAAANLEIVIDKVVN